MHLTVAIKTALVMFLMSVLLIGAYYGLGRKRGYLFYLGMTFLALGASCLSRGWLMLVLLLGALAAFMTACRDALEETKERVRQFRQEQQEREEAFAEYLTAVAQQQEPDHAEKQAP